MPYSGPKDPNLPDHVKKMSEHMKKQWVEVFNSAMQQHNGDESKAFAIANGVVKKKKDLISSFYSIDTRQLDQTVAKYDAMGGGGGKGCANCHWFVPQDDGCICVEGDIMPTGICSLWMAQPEHVVEPIPVTIIKESGLRAFATNLKDMALALLGTNENDSAGDSDNTNKPDEQPLEPPGPVAPVQSVKSFILYKQDDGQLRFFTTFSNYFKDKHKEFLKGEAHQEYVDYATKTGNYPDLWLWHSGPESKWGKVDWLEYSDGFVVASGLVDKGKEELAEAISKEDLGVSHGFYGLQLLDTVYRYRTFEISPLPMVSAANSITDINFLFKECEMPFSEAKKTWLKDVAKIPAETITSWETSLAGLSEKMKALGLEWKEAESKDTVDPIAELASLSKSVSDIASVLADVVQKQKALETDMDTKIANTFTAKIAELPKGFVASESDNNKVGDAKSKEAQDWFGEVVLAKIGK